MAVASTASDYLGVLLLGRTGQGKSTTGNKLLKAGGESVLHDDEIGEFEVGDGGESCTREIRSVLRRGTENAKAVQVVDTPGFADCNAGVRQRGVNSANLALFCDLLRKLINDKVRIHRVLYFLPCRGPLERADGALQKEIELMHHFFGNAVFDRMVLVATLHKRYEHLGFSDEDKEDTRKTFETALMSPSIGNDRPKCPPVIFIGADDAGVDILYKIENAVVSNKALTLDKVVPDICSRCSAKYLCHEDDDPSDSENRIGAMVPTKREEQKNSEEVYIPYHSSQCHPLFVPKHNLSEKVVGGVAHILTLGIPMLVWKLTSNELPWPTFTSGGAMCANCRQCPGSDGCMKVGSKYRTTLPTGKSVDVIADHTN